jgi:hypothetical protein
LLTMRVWAFLLSVLACGCLCNPMEDGGSPGGGGILGKIAGDDSPAECKVPPEAAGLTAAECGKMKNAFEKASCHTAIALSTGNPSACDKIAANELKAGCVSVLAGCRKDASLCDRLGEDVGLQYLCIGAVAKAKKDASLCDAMENPRYKTPCIEGVAAASGNVKLCDGLDGKADRDHCRVEVAVENKDASACAELEDTLDYFEYQCYQKVGKAALDLSVCDKIKPEGRAEEEMLADCVKTVANARNDSGICGKVSDIEYRDYHCTIVVARNTRNLALCDGVTDKNRKNYCLGAVAVASQDVSICLKMHITDGAFTFPTPLNECVTEIAKAKGDKGICDKAYDKRAQNECKSKVH